MRHLTVAATQMACSWDIPGNIARAEALVRAAAARGARLILIQELFETPYFCQDQLHEYLALAKPLEGNPLIAHFAALARELGVVLPLSFFERAGQAAFNSLAVIDADGSIAGVYRKSHIPDGPGYTEKFYFSPGDTGFRVWNTKVGRIGVGICWDQWFPECARAMALMGAEILLYPTAIGSEPHDPTLESAAHWQRVMQGHAGANLMPLVASNRIGTEAGRNGTSITFYGSSFIADPTGAKVAEAGRDEETVLTATFDLDAIAQQRHS
ncbi:N-carbamoylputrescine amidase [Ancylobacter lacus]|uniref:N-carbamoylputrescine amidase n=1 Tax=Ancylobacter lacus TaxID=2579970 RepID=UPI001BCFFF62|nr:N-carbamoylputrescine amidase [Ancylobacter lacus]